MSHGGHLFNALGHWKGTHILDAGCSFSNVAIRLARGGFRVHGSNVPGTSNMLCRTTKQQVCKALL